MLWKTTALIVTLAIAPNAAAQVVTPPAVPANLEVPDGTIPYLIARAEGTQNYVCRADKLRLHVDVLRAAGHVVRTMAVSRSRRTFSVPIPLRVALRVPRGSTRATPAPSGPRRSQTPLTPASSRRVRFLAPASSRWQ